jgi:DNA-binding transcriptional LysR family regulator
MAALEQIQSSTANLQQLGNNSQSLTLNITPSLSNLWLIPRLKILSESLPNLRLNMVSGDGVFQFHQASADIAIRCLPLSLSHENSTLLAEEVLLPVIHPSLLLDKPINNASDLCIYLLEDANVSTVTGEAFGDPDCMRMSYAASEKDLKTAIARIKESLAKLA